MVTYRQGLALVLSCLMLLAVVAPVGAHGTGAHIMGTVTAVSEERLDVTTQKGEHLSVHLTEKTEFQARGKDTTASRPQVGDRVVIEASGKSPDLTATEVLFASPKGAATGK